jgi:hypothetical protein
MRRVLLACRWSQVEGTRDDRITFAGALRIDGKPVVAALDEHPARVGRPDVHDEWGADRFVGDSMGGPQSLLRRLLQKFVPTTRWRTTTPCEISVALARRSSARTTTGYLTKTPEVHVDWGWPM